MTILAYCKLLMAGIVYNLRKLAIYEMKKERESEKSSILFINSCKIFKFNQSNLQLFIIKDIR